MKKNGIYIVFLITFVAIAAILGYTSLKTQDKNLNSCTVKGCHLNLVKNKFVHSPAKDDCGTCHNLTGLNHPADSGKEYSLSSKVPDLCTTCHDIPKDPKHPHVPFADGECTTCHSPHSSSQKHILNLVDGKLVCLSCHDMINKDTVVHDPVKQSNCLACHGGHSSNTAKLLIKEGAKLCLSCHNKTIKTKTHETANIGEKIGKKNVHAPIGMNGCSDCHLPHTSKYNVLLKEKYSSQSYVLANKESFTLCLQCHDENLFSTEKTTSATSFRNGDNNLHNLHILKNNKGRNCSLCHDVHGTSNENLISEKVKFGNWNYDMNFSKTPNGGTCGPGCHKSLTYDRNYVARIEQLADDAKNKKQQPKKETKDKPDVALKPDTKEIKDNTDIIKKPDIIDTTNKLAGIERADTIKGILTGYLINNDGIDPKVLAELTLQVKNGDSSYNETVVVDDQLKFTLNNIPYGNYIASIDEDDLKSANVDVLVKAKPFKVDSALNGKSNIALDFEIKKKQVIGKDTIIAAVPKPIVKVKPNVTKTIYYDEGKKPGLKSDFKNYANGIIAHLKKNPKSRVAIVTHTDDQGTLEEREALTRSIHEKIIKYFVEKGISKQRILVQTKGSLNPAEPNTTAKGRAKNRRIEIKILK